MKKFMVMSILALTSIGAIKADFWEEMVETVKKPGVTVEEVIKVVPVKEVEKVKKSIVKKAPAPIQRGIRDTERDIQARVRQMSPTQVRRQAERTAAEAQKTLGLVKPVPQKPASLSPAQQRRQNEKKLSLYKISKTPLPGAEKAAKAAAAEAQKTLQRRIVRPMQMR